MQDNASIHTAHKVKDWFEENGIQTTDWPPYSPDLNPIEHA
jgi:transposase